MSTKQASVASFLICDLRKGLPQNRPVAVLSARQFAKSPVGDISPSSSRIWLRLNLIVAGQ